MTTDRRYFHSKCEALPLPLAARLAVMMSFSSAVRNLHRSGESGSKKKTRGESTTVAMPSRMKILLVSWVEYTADGRNIPSPAGKSRLSVQMVDSESQRAAECAGEDADDVERGDAALKLFTRVPIADERQCGREETCRSARIP